MRKSGIYFLLAAMALFIAMFVQDITASAASGDLSTPHSALDYHKITFQESAAQKPRTLEFGEFAHYSGENANYILKQDSSNYSPPASDEQWILLGFDLDYLSGQDNLKASDFISSTQDFYTSSGQKITPLAVSTFKGDLAGYGEKDVIVAPGRYSEVWYGIKLKKSVGFPLIKIGTGINKTTGAVTYKWFSTDPNYLEPVLYSKATSASETSIKLSWTAANGEIDGYEIFRSTSKNGPYTKLGAVAGTSITDSGLKTGTTYYYKIRTFFDTGYRGIIYGKYSPIVSAKPVPAAPQNFKAYRYSPTSVKMSWNAVSGANGYEIHMATSQTGAYTHIRTTTNTSAIRTQLTTGKPYYFKVRAYKMVGTAKVYGNWTVVKSATPSLSVPTDFKAYRYSPTSVKMSWGAVSGATGYEIHRATSYSGTYSHIRTTDKTSAINTQLTTGTRYYFKVRAYKLVGTKRVYSGWTAIKNATPSLSVPTDFKAYRYSPTSVKMSWGAVSGANGYEIHMATSQTGTYTHIRTTTNTSAIRTQLTTGKTYYFKVRAYKMVGTKRVYSGWTVIKSARPY
ncbi:fibronectin type III domain-containing protein [Bacillus sp. EB01]|uniref:fibronectin type III domain-containing protein n=1 Tax=Bacillus sp. EB01 TaxID=1347086 RepID=UPI0005C4A9DA|nr:fibronectin type III domain-containing protein [Bacillus sp. EB01]